ncbi:hypothetical protein H9X57_12900 [Flavobacterium piscinae]|uniref:hypothetical protein n=1 Tax=Flavobacterium piscinae TaxID=2506424 RepID=UPI001997BF76|nr:hypothetical protein [Flavobacterium piscinae]MBC8883928.1 hypothetical protein [Flavobacterium piscinae]
MVNRLYYIQLFNTTGEGANLIGPPQNEFTNTNFGVFIQNSGTFILRGGEVKTFKNNNGNACSVRMNYRVYLESDTPGSFNTIDFPFLMIVTRPLVNSLRVALAGKVIKNGKE